MYYLELSIIEYMYWWLVFVVDYNIVGIHYHEKQRVDILHLIQE
jgi:hypothetical protein